MQVQIKELPEAGQSEGQLVPWGAILSMSLCAFALVASEFMPVSLLTPIASDLVMTEGQAGQVISVSGLFAVVTSLFIAVIAGKMDRKVLLLGLTGLMVISGVLVATASTYAMMMVGRALLGVAVGGYWSMSTAIMIRIAPGPFVPKALALLQGGTALATAVAAPMGSFLGGLIGWRGAFFCVVPLAAAALLWQAMTLPTMPPKGERKAVNALRLLANPTVACGMAAVTLLFMGQFTLFTYLRPFLETVGHVDVTTLSLMLLIIGVAGLIGTIFIGSLLTDRLYSILIIIPILMAAIAFALLVFGSHLVVVAILLGAWGLISTPAPVGWFTWLSRTLPEDAEAGGGLMVALLQFAITLGATVGGALFDWIGYQGPLSASAVLLLVASGLSVVTSRSR